MRLMIDTVGADDFGLVSLVLTVQLIFPFLDLGTSAAVLEAGARHHARADSDTLAMRIRFAATITFCTSLAVFVLTIAVSTAGAWPAILGRDDAKWLNAAMVATVGLNVVTRPLNVCLAALIGLGRAPSVVLLQGAVAPVALLTVLMGRIAPFPPVVFAVSVLVGQLVCGAAAAIFLLRHAPALLRSLLRKRPDHLKSGDGLQGRSGPMLTINLVAPFGAGFDRFILSHLATADDLARYSVGAQIFQSAYGLVLTIQQALWAEFSQRRASEIRAFQDHVWRTSWVVLPAGLAGALALSLVAPGVAHLASDGEVSLGGPLLWALAGAFALQMALTVPGAALTEPRELRAQASILIVSVLLNVGVSLLLSARLGAAGPALGTFAGVALQLGLSVLVLARSFSPGPRTHQEPDIQERTDL